LTKPCYDHDHLLGIVPPPRRLSRDTLFVVAMGVAAGVAIGCLLVIYQVF